MKLCSIISLNFNIKKRWDSQFTNANFQWSCMNSIKPAGWVSMDLQYKIYQKQSEFTTWDNTAQKPYHLYKKCNKHKMHASFFTIFIWNICCSNKYLASYMWFTSEILPDKHVGIKLNACYFSTISTSYEMGPLILLKLPNIKFHENLFFSSQVASYM